MWLPCRSSPRECRHVYQPVCDSRAEAGPVSGMTCAIICAHAVFPPRFTILRRFIFSPPSPIWVMAQVHFRKRRKPAGMFWRFPCFRK